MNDIEFEEKVALCAYKPLDEINEEEWRLLEIEKNRCQSFIYFLKYARLIRTPTVDNPGGIVLLELWSHIKIIIGSLLKDTQISIAKSRQIGVSTIIAYYVLWFAMFRQGANILLFSKGEDEAKELLAKSIRLYDQLPYFLRIKCDPKSTETLGFPSMKSRIKTFAATSSAGLGETASIVVCDEHAEHPYAEEHYRAVRPTLSVSKGQFISIWTKNPWESDNLAQRLFVDAMEGKNDFHWIFFPWYVVPGRDAQFYESEKRGIPEEMLAKLGAELYMQANFPASLEELLSRPQTVSAFDHKILTQMMDNTKLPMDIKKDFDPLMCHIYQDFNSINSYIAASDTSHGVGRDYAVTVIMNTKTGAVVADILSNVLGPEELALHSVKLLKVYDNPLWFIEDNDWGRSTITVAQTLGYTNFGYQDTKRKIVGFHTGEKGRFDIFGSLIPAINNAEITIYNVNGLKQFFDVIRNSKKNGRIEASGSGHDDYPMAVGICWLKKDEVSPVWDYEPVRALTFRR